MFCILHITGYAVFSLAGVVLIARPAAIFGVDSNFWAPGAGPDRESNEKGTSAQRLVAVW